VADTTKSDSHSFAITASGITVTITDKVNAVVAGTVVQSIRVTANTQNDLTNSGVSWSLTSSGVACSPACGAIQSGATTSLAVYQPPASPSAAPVSITATSVHDRSKSDVDTFAIIGAGTAVSSCASASVPTGRESLLNGRYAFFAQGTSVMAASFAADGAGNIQDLGGGVGGEMDSNDGNNAEHFVVIPTATNAGSFYRVGTDATGAGPVGCLSLYTSSGATTIFRFALGQVNSSGVATEGRITEFDDQFAAGATEGTRASGPLRLQDATAFASGDTIHLQKNYAFGVGGSGGPHAVVVGAFVLDPATGVITDSDFDSDDLNAALAQSDVQGTGSIGSVSTKTGRAIFTLTPKSPAKWPGGLQQTQAALYVVNSSEFFLVTADPASIGINAGPPVFLYAGRAIISGTGFTFASLAGNFILHETGAAVPGACSSAQCADVSLGLLNFASGNSSVAGTIFEYNTKNGGSTTTLAGSATYAVSAKFGRVSLSLTGSGLTHPPVFYLAQPTASTESIDAFVGGTDPAAIAASGLLEPGASTNITTATLKGNYFFGDGDDPADLTISNRVGVLTIANTGSVAGTQFTSGPAGLSLATSAPISSVTIDNAKGPGTGNVGANTVAITNGSAPIKLFFIDETSGTPASITVVEPQ
jgi:hypothetical protein